MKSKVRTKRMWGVFDGKGYPWAIFKTRSLARYDASWAERRYIRPVTVSWREPERGKHGKD